MRGTFAGGLTIALTAVAALWAGQSRAADKMKVVATFSVIGDMVANVAGDHVELVTIVGPDGDTELYQPTLADSRTVAAARIVFMNDLNDEFEPWLEPLLKQAGFGGTKVVVSRGAKTLTAEDEHAISGRNLPPAIDQHAWLDPRNGMVYAKRRVISSHDSLGYLAKAFGITLISIYGWTNKSEPSAAEVSRLTQQVEQEHVRALFLDSITDPRIMQRVAKETGAVIGGTIYGDALSPPGGEADTYIGMLRHDITTLKAGMLNN
jgi:zinc/manganese transport system substrate-binding protein